MQSQICAARIRNAQRSHWKGRDIQGEGPDFAGNKRMLRSPLVLNLKHRRLDGTLKATNTS